MKGGLSVIFKLSGFFKSISKKIGVDTAHLITHTRSHSNRERREMSEGRGKRERKAPVGAVHVACSCPVASKRLSLQPLHLLKSDIGFSKS